MEVILLENVRNLGQLGDKVDVKSGYARNFLLPLGHAVRATGDNLAEFETRRAELEKKAADTLATAEQRAEQIAALSVTMAARAGDEGKLFGSIGVREIVIAITQAGSEVTKKEVQLPNGPLRVTGDHEVTLQLHPEVQTTLVINIVEDKE